MTLPSQEHSTSRKMLMRRMDKKEGRKHRWLRAGVVVAVLVLVLVAAFVGYRLWLNARLNAALDRIRAAGYPVTTQELAAWYPYPKGKNAADVYEQAFKAFVDDEALEKKLPPTSSDFDLKWPPPGEPLPPEMKHAAEVYLAENAKAITLLEQAVKIGQTRYPIDFSQGTNAYLPQLGRLRRAGRLLGLRAELSARQGDGDGFVQMIQTLAGIAHSLDREPVFVAYLIRISLFAMFTDVFERGIQSLSLSEAQLQRLSDVVVGGIGGDGMMRALVGLRVFVIHGPHRWLVNSLETARWESYKFSGLYTLDRVAFLRFMRVAIEYAKHPMLRNRARIDQIMQSVPDRYLITRNRGSDAQYAMMADLQVQTSLQTIRVGLAAMRYRLAHGALPMSLSDLTPQYLKAVPTDPFANPQAPLQYHRTSDGAVIYSVGKDGIDNGGRKVDKHGAPYRPGTDIAFILKPARRLSGH